MLRNGPEYWRLKRLFMYRPSSELSLVNKSNYRDYLFRAVVDPEAFQRQYDAYLDIFREHSVEVLLLNDVLEQINWKPSFFPPNLVFMRDVFAVLESTIVLSNMRYEIRRYEPYIVKKSFEKLGWNITYIFEATEYFEGGDLLYLNENTILLGYGPRTSFQAAYKLGKQINDNFRKNAILIPLPPYRVHLDGTMMILDNDLIVAHKRSLMYYPSLIMYSDGDYDVINFYDYLGENNYAIIDVPDNELNTFGPSFVVIRKGLVISYAWNDKTIKELVDMGIEVITFNGYEFMKAGGGLHCLFNTLLRTR